MWILNLGEKHNTLKMLFKNSSLRILDLVVYFINNFAAVGTEMLRDSSSCHDLYTASSQRQSNSSKSKETVQSGNSMYCKLFQIINKNNPAFKLCYLFPVMPATVIGKAEEPPPPLTKPSGNLWFKIPASKWPLLPHNILDILGSQRKKPGGGGGGEEIIGTNFSHAAIVRRSQHKGCTSRRKQVIQSFDVWKTRVKGFDILHEKDKIGVKYHSVPVEQSKSSYK